MTARQAVADHGALQDIWELETALGIIGQLPPESVAIEIGSMHGGSLNAWASLGVPVIGMTLNPVSETHDALMVYGDSHDAAVQEQVKSALAGRDVSFGFIDGDHSEAGCQADLDFLLSLGTAIIGFHDLVCPINPGVKLVWNRVKAGRRHVEIINPTTPEIVNPGVVWPMGTGLIWT